MSKTDQQRVMSIALKPRFWGTAIGLAVMWLIHLLPIRFQFWLGKVCGNLLYRFAKRRRHIAKVNIDLCFPKLEPEQRQQLLKRTFQSVGISLFEIPLSWWASDRRLHPLAHLHGAEHVTKAQQQGRGILLLGAHFICLEIGGRLLTMDIPTINMYKRHKNPLFEAVMVKNRLKHLAGLIEHRNVREYIRALQQGKTCWYAPDQDFGSKGNSVFAPFMGVQAATLTAVSRFAKMGNAVVIPFFPKRRLDGTGYDLMILPALENFPSGDDVKDAETMNKIIQEQVILAPDQYLWLHRRFKSGPGGKTKLYQT